MLLGEGPFPGIIDLFGGIGGLIEFRASLLAARGFAVLALAYIAYEDLPKYLMEVDLEYFEEAANLLLAHPKVFKILFILPCHITAEKKITNVCFAHFTNLFRHGHSTGREGLETEKTNPKKHQNAFLLHVTTLQVEVGFESSTNPSSKKSSITHFPLGS